MLTTCDLCNKITSNGVSSSRSNKPNYNEIILHGTCQVFIYGVKSYVNKCCIKTLYFGSYNYQGPFYIQKLFSNIRIKAPKYVLLENKKIMVYELNLKNNEIIDRPDGFTKLDKLEINRFINYIEYPNKYEFITKTKFENPNITNIINNDINKLENNIKCSNFEYIYLIQDRTSVNMNESIYKIGRTNQLNFERFKSYPKGYKILLHVVCNNCTDIELKLINIFKCKYIQATKYGNEYFEGDYKMMIKDIFENI